MEIRQHVIEYLKTLKEVTHHTNADESDELETQKLIETKGVHYYGLDQEIYEDSSYYRSALWCKK
ncbi:MAG: hypothetical protein CM15mV15_0120 [uncultured marine virus]|nr:MAG: hypothetical protein CM15mV15_0120 [uncultured marine virus]